MKLTAVALPYTVLLLLVSSCASDSSKPAKPAPPPPNLPKVDGRLRFGIVAAEATPERFDPLATYVKTAIGADTSVVVLDDDAAAVAALTAGSVDVATLSGYAFASTTGLTPVCQRLEDRNVAAHFITGKDAKIYMATELKGKRLALAQRDTATTLMARWYMDYIKTGPEIVDDAIEVGSDAAVVEAVAVGKVDVGLLDERGKVLFDNKLIEGTDRVRHFYSTPSFADRLWAARPGLEPALAQALTKAMEALDDREVLDLFGASKFLAADATGWARLRGSIQAAKAVK